MKLNNWILMAAMTMGLVACNNDDAPESTLPEGKGKTVTVTIKGNKVDSRAANDGNAFTTETKATLTSATIFFLTDAATTGTVCDYRDLAVTESPQQLHNVNPAAKAAYVVGNIDLSGKHFNTLADLLNLPADLSDYTTLASVPVTSGATATALTEGGNHDAAATDHTNGKMYTVAFTVNPILSRIEIGGTVTLTMGDNANQFTFSSLKPTHVGLNKVAPSFTLAGAPSGAPLEAGDNAKGYPGDLATAESWMFDVLNPEEMITDATTAVPFSLPVHGYNLAAGSQPIVMLAFDSKKADDAVTIPPVPRAYLKIINFTDQATDANKKVLAAGKIYKIENLTIKNGELTNLDNTVICVEATVTVGNWGVDTITTPEYGK
ncbi:hypothetical protein [Bacteroides clarus]|uniref:Major fimbrial subunit protein N-terminal domain-containing protein n=1 Tax=Bacteroides clarus TaxID=626929 RepID=A0A412YHR1_9BACE|nr:hypothetical protein [Bacteroides clarus]RGV56949.1 hypothetical protein DWW09_05620 [Bacteroides clarus]